MRLIRSLIFLLALLCFAGTVQAATTYYVRSDGGTATQCTGTTDAAYPGTGSAQACAFNNPQWAIPPGYPGDGATAPKLAAGDTLHIASGSYQVGYGSPGATACKSSYPYNCVFSPQNAAALPANITVVGDCTAPPTLWAGGGAYNVFNLTGSSGVTIKCLELTDHSQCIYGTFSGLPTCAANGSGQVGATSGQDGIDIRGAADVTLQDLNIHGFPYYGILAGRLTGTTTVDGVVLRANALGGWSGDLGGNNDQSKNSGTLNFTNVTIAWNGCTEAYPATTVVGCRGAEQGGYGDGLGTALTGGNWTFKNSRFLYNTSDGLDMLYADGTGSILVDNVISIGNASQQVKVSAPATVRNSIINGQCNSTELSSRGLTSLCRAAGNAVELDFTATGQTIDFSYNTVTGNGDCLISSGNGSAAPAGFVADPTDTITLSNNVLLGQVSALGKNGGGYICALYPEGTQTVTWNNTIVWHTRNTNFSTPGIINVDPKLKDQSMDTFDPTPLTGSPAKSACVGAAPNGRTDLICH